MPGRYLGFGHERLNPEKVSEKAKLFRKAKTSVDKNHSNAVTRARGGGGGGGRGGGEGEATSHTFS